MLPKVKIILIGEDGVGKTSLFRTFIEGVYPDLTSATIGVDFGCKKMEFDGSMFHLQIWDTAGQERYRKIISANVDGSHGIMLLYDTTQFKTLINLFEWLESIQQIVGEINIPMLLVGTKCDLKSEKIVTHDIAKNIADQLNTVYIETSAKHSINVDEAFLNLLKQINERQTIPKRYDSYGIIGLIKRLLGK